MFGMQRMRGTAVAQESCSGQTELPVNRDVKRSAAVPSFLQVMRVDPQNTTFDLR
jgi:hypothetical protein